MFGEQGEELPAGAGGQGWLFNGPLLERDGRAALHPHNLTQWTLLSLSAQDRASHHKTQEETEKTLCSLSVLREEGWELLLSGGGDQGGGTGV